MAQTAIEYLIEQYKINPYDCMISTGLFAKALEKEKEQIIDAAVWGALFETGDKYYEKTYSNAGDLAILLEKEGEKYNL